MINAIKKIFKKENKKPTLNFNHFIDINGFRVIRVRNTEDARRKMNLESIHSSDMITADINWLQDGTGILKIRKRKTAL